MRVEDTLRDRLIETRDVLLPTEDYDTGNVGNPLEAWFPANIPPTHATTLNVDVHAIRVPVATLTQTALVVP